MKHEDIEKIIEIANRPEVDAEGNPGHNNYYAREKRREISELIDTTGLLKLKDELVDWCDWDGAMHRFGTVLGIFEPTQKDWFKNKGTFWSNNKLGTLLHALLQDLVKAEILQYRDDEDHDMQFRFNPDWQNVVNKIDIEMNTTGDRVLDILGIKEIDPEKKEQLENCINFHTKCAIDNHDREKESGIVDYGPESTTKFSNS